MKRTKSKKNEMNQMVSEMFEEVQKGKKTNKALEVVAKKHDLNARQTEILLYEFENNDIEISVAQM
jgi:hypothetical protein